MYQIIRIFYKGEIETHSIEERATWREALARYHNIIAADLNNSEITYCYTALLHEEGYPMLTPFKYSIEQTEDGDDISPFEYVVARVKIKAGQRSTSIEYKNHIEALKRYLNILATDLQDEEVTYNMAVIINSNGDIEEYRAFIEGME